MSGSCPPGLRFPSGAICGTHLIFAGTYLSQSYQTFSIWALDLQTMTWARIDPGTALSTGSWFKGCLWSAPYTSSASTDSTKSTSFDNSNKSKFVIFGDQQGSLVDDYNRRLLSWEDVVVIDLEVFGIYQPPTFPATMNNICSQELGLAALEEGLFTDFEVGCVDGRSIKCSRRLLEERWSWFREQRNLFGQRVDGVLGKETNGISSNKHLNGSNQSLLSKSSKSNLDTNPPPTPDPRLTPRTLHLSESYPVTLALIQYFYTLALLTPLQHAPAVLTQLLIIGTAYDLPHLRAIVMHAMHGALSPATSLGVYEVATLCSCQSLQIR